MTKDVKQLARELGQEATRRERELREEVKRREREIQALRTAAEELRGKSAVVSNGVSNGRG